MEQVKIFTHERPFLIEHRFSNCCVSRRASQLKLHGAQKKGYQSTLDDNKV